MTKPKTLDQHQAEKEQAETQLAQEQDVYKRQDDGISGTCFDRPGFLAMMKEVEFGNVEYLCIKDMSCLLYTSYQM